MDAEVEGAEAILPRGGVRGESSADGAEQASRGGAGGGGVEALQHGLGGAVRGVARGPAVRQEGIDVLVLDRWRRHLPSAWIGWWARSGTQSRRWIDGSGGGWKDGDGEENGGEGACSSFIGGGGGGPGRRGDAAVDDGGTQG